MSWFAAFHRYARLSLVAVLTGCAASPPIDYYLLEPLAKPVPQGSPAAGVHRAIGIGPVRFPRYLDRPQLVVAQTGGQLRLRDGERWADNLRENFSRVLAENLQALLPDDRFLLHPWSRAENVDLKLTLRINEFHLSEAGFASLDARWELFDKKGLLVTRQTRARFPADAADPAAGVMALSRTVDALAKACVASIRMADGASSQGLNAPMRALGPQDGNILPE